MQVQLPSGNEDLEFRAYDETLLSTLTGSRGLGGPSLGGLEAESVASLRLGNTLWKESLSKRCVWAMTEGLEMPYPEVNGARCGHLRSSGPILDLTTYPKSASLPLGVN